MGQRSRSPQPTWNHQLLINTRFPHRARVCGEGLPLQASCWIGWGLPPPGQAVSPALPPALPGHSRARHRGRSTSRRGALLLSPTAPGGRRRQAGPRPEGCTPRDPVTSRSRTVNPHTARASRLTTGCARLRSVRAGRAAGPGQSREQGLRVSGSFMRGLVLPWEPCSSRCRLTWGQGQTRPHLAASVSPGERGCPACHPPALPPQGPRLDPVGPQTSI